MHNARCISLRNHEKGSYPFFEWFGHLNPFHVEEVERRRGGTGVEDAVDIETDARLDAVVGESEGRAKAADVDRRVARIS